MEALKLIFPPFQPKYYDGDYKKMLEILIGCKKTGSTFLVGGRNVDGVFKVCSHIRSLTNFLLISNDSFLSFMEVVNSYS